MKDNHKEIKLPDIRKYLQAMVRSSNESKTGYAKNVKGSFWVLLNIVTILRHGPLLLYSSTDLVWTIARPITA
jgi:hypothetical protein